MMHYYTLNNGQRTPLDELAVFCECPKCGKRTRVPEFWQFLAQSEVELYGSSFYCRNCHKRVIRSGKGIRIP